jgi:hypothetical protein
LVQKLDVFLKVRIFQKHMRDILAKIGLHIQSGVGFKVIAKSTSAQPVDYIFVDLKVFGTRVLVAVVYCPPRIDRYPHHGQILDKYRQISSCRNYGGSER